MGSRMIFVGLCLALTAAAAATSTNGSSYPVPPICATQECIPYEVIHSQKEFEVRNYSSATWIGGPNITTVTYALGKSASYSKAYFYFRGENVERFDWDDKIKPQPLLTDVTPNSSVDATYRTYLRIPKESQNKPLPHPYEGHGESLVKLPLNHKLGVAARVNITLTEKSIEAALAVFKNNLKGTPWESAAAPPTCTVAQYLSPLSEFESLVELLLWF